MISGCNWFTRARNSLKKALPHLAFAPFGNWMPVAPGRSLGVLVEVAARNQLLRTRGLNAARDLATRLEQTLREKDLHADAESEDDVEHGGHV